MKSSYGLLDKGLISLGEVVHRRLSRHGRGEGMQRADSLELLTPGGCEVSSIKVDRRRHGYEEEVR